MKNQIRRYLSDRVLMPLTCIMIALAVIAVFYSIYAAQPQVALSALVFLLLATALVDEHRKRRQDRQITALVDEAFIRLDRIADGGRWLGSASEIICRFPARHLSEKSQRYEHYRWTLLCRTKKKAWFVLEIDTQLRKVIGEQVYRIDNNEAADMLSGHPNLYAKHFAMPEVA